MNRNKIPSQNPTKSYFKMYKSGKFWIASGISVFTLGVGSSISAAADNIQIKNSADSTSPYQQLQSGQMTALPLAESMALQPESVSDGGSLSPSTSRVTSQSPLSSVSHSEADVSQAVGLNSLTLSSTDSTLNTGSVQTSSSFLDESELPVLAVATATVASQSTATMPVHDSAGDVSTAGSTSTDGDLNQATSLAQSTNSIQGSSVATIDNDVIQAQSMAQSTVVSQSVAVTTRSTVLSQDLSQASSLADSTSLSQQESRSQDLSQATSIAYSMVNSQSTSLSLANNISIFNLENLVNSGLTNDQVVQSILAQDKHLKFDQGKFYFVDDQGNIQKNFTAIINNQTLYFSKDTGQLQALRNQYTDGLTDISNAHNAAATLQNSSFNTIDGFMTADSWYRPKDILKDGTTWTPSTTTDFRPLLMTWWPDKGTQIAYLAYAKTKGWLPDNVDVTDSNQSYLTQLSDIVQANIEKQISAKDGQTDWLRQDFSDFVKSQSGWNIGSEQFNGNTLQGGSLLYVNNELTPAANSPYRLLNRNTTNQDGSHPNQGGFELLLANDIDNSNPAVQAEQLNWLYYMMNIGSIVANDPAGNFDGYRVDAVDNVDSDLLDIASQYFKLAYGIDLNDANANKHLSILEDWGFQDPAYIKAHGNNQLTMDFLSNLASRSVLTNSEGHREQLSNYISSGLVNRSGDKYQENVEQPNYNFIRAHDSLVQEVIAQIVREKVNPNADGLNMSVEDIQKAFEIYNADQLKTDKQYNLYNLPAAYALLLTNKDTVPRVYYGDLFSDDGQYMAHKTIYYDALTNLLQSRVKYVAGGQNMAVQTVYGTDAMAVDSSKEILTSVRYGKGADTRDSIGTAETRTQGMGVVISNNPNLQLADNDRVTLNMGLAHQNEAYRAVLLTTANGLESYTTDQAPVVWTDSHGVLTFDKQTIYGVRNPQVSGYLAVWVPVGATENQDARTAGSLTPHQDGATFHSNAALDSQLIFEGFSNFQALPTTTDEYTNVKIAQNASLFKAWGITSFELAPQYRSSTDSSFLDAIIQNGYAFTDRYDIGYDGPTKYGTAGQLVDALKALHQEGISAINDWVPDQIYNLPGKQVVTAQRVDAFGHPIKDAVINNTLYVANTIGGGQYQKEFGGAFLDQLKNQYPILFTTKQISTGQPMNPDEKITEWSAKYFNGTNIQGHGAFYVLKDAATQQYFMVDQNGHFLPKQILGETANTGFSQMNGKTVYFSTSGYQAKNSFIQDGDNWYYFDQNGYMVYGDQTIDGFQYFFLPNGVQLKDAYLYRNGTTSYYNAAGRLDSEDHSGDSSTSYNPYSPYSPYGSGSGSGSTSQSGSTPPSTSTSESTPPSGSTSTSESTPPSNSTSTSESTPPSTSTSTSESTPPSGSTSTSESTPPSGSTSTSESTPPSQSTSISTSMSTSTSTSTTPPNLPPTGKQDHYSETILGLVMVNAMLFVGIKRYRKQ